MTFEVVVRPVVLPDIRPAPARSLPPVDNPDSGFATIHGNGVKAINFTESYSMNWSKQRPTETERRFDEVRVYQQNADGTVNRDNFVDVEVANKITMTGVENGPESNAADDLITGGSKPGGKGNSTEIANYYAREIERENTEIRKRDETRKNEAGE